ncbi:RNA-binding protein [Candidatus Woesebacteria bacterium CG22_combo_CG10-13_8_21_14_all_39_10]|uniref:RNA-binding protein n=2 Tax=Candidatus Woeseibacteriota TaxID=1752722 RepID=A0A2M7AQ52_9BACT|nr:MAG: RNA-binding protein [Candidatus Woesebacteria bacterium CG22_combo_CG10-13_8_21_14_all_39_10]PIU71719.1 MAG: RNA-binding protein [Candidatus Woesebacteria bacterium CG06_land_8_20_14_3_00_39_27]
MKELLEYILKGILGETDFYVTEEVDGNFVRLFIKVEPENAGMVIGKGGATIKAIRSLLRVKATLEKKGISVNLAE